MMKDNYEDIIYLPHYEPKNYPRMSSNNRASQFAPFSALTGYEEQVKETARLTNKRMEIDEGLKNVLNNKLQVIQMNIKSNPEITIVYFVPDKKKSGGTYISITGNVKKIDTIKELIIMRDNTKIPMNDILSIAGDILNIEEIS